VEGRVCGWQHSYYSYILLYIYIAIALGLRVIFFFFFLFILVVCLGLGFFFFFFYDTLCVLFLVVVFVYCVGVPGVCILCVHAVSWYTGIDMNHGIMYYHRRIIIQRLSLVRRHPTSFARHPSAGCSQLTCAGNAAHPPRAPRHPHKHTLAIVGPGVIRHMCMCMWPECHIYSHIGLCGVCYRVLHRG